MTSVYWLKPTIASLLVGVLALSACVSKPQLPVRSVSYSDDPLSIIWIHAYPSHDGVNVSGLVKRQHVGYAPITGYIRVDAINADREILATEHFSVVMMTMRKKQGKMFSVQLHYPDPSLIDHVEARYVAHMQI